MKDTSQRKWKTITHKENVRIEIRTIQWSLAIKLTT